MPEAVQQPFVWPVRVYYEDTDAGGVVYHASYLKFMERARTEWLRAKGFEQSALLRDHDVIFVVRAVQVEYLRPALFDDLLNVTVRLAGAGRSQMEVAQTVEHPGKGDTLAKAMVKVVCVNGRSFKPVAIPAAIL
jgi:acyl-CoA thioester hydrolase